MSESGGGDAAWEEMAARTGRPFADGGAYASDMFADWRGCVMLLRALGFSVENAECVLRSKHMRWCADQTRETYGHATMTEFGRYIDRNKVAEEFLVPSPVLGAAEQIVAMRATLEERDKEIAATKTALSAVNAKIDQLLGRIEAVLPYVVATLPYPNSAVLHSSVTTSNPEWIAIHGGRGRSSARQLQALLEEARSVKARG